MYIIVKSVVTGIIRLWTKRRAGILKRKSINHNDFFFREKLYFMNIWGITKKYKTLSWWENFMSGHWNIGKNITIYGENAMHWAVNIRTKKYGYICFTLPLRCFGRYWGCHIYFSPNGTPWASTYYKSLWKENNKSEELRARIRKLNFGHNFNIKGYAEMLRALNDKFDSFTITDYDMMKFLENSFEDAWTCLHNFSSNPFCVGGYAGRNDIMAAKKGNRLDDWTAATENIFMVKKASLWLSFLYEWNMGISLHFLVGWIYHRSALSFPVGCGWY